MGLFSKDIKSMDDLFVHTLRDIYYAEKQILQALPEMIDKASDAQLKQGLQTHLRETQGQVQRIEKVFQLHGVQAKGVNCPAIDGIIEEANDVAGEVADKAVLDLALIAAAQAVEHYEITRYGCLVAWAKQLGRSDCAALLQQNLDEEKATDKKLTAMAEGGVNSAGGLTCCRCRGAGCRPSYGAARAFWRDTGWMDSPAAQEDSKR